MPLQPEDLAATENDAPEADESSEQEGESTASLPLSLFGDKSPEVGSRITLEVRSVDADGGTVLVSYEPPETEDEDAKGIDALAAKFD